MSGHRLTMRQLWVLGFLRDHPGATLTQISEGSPVDEAKRQRSIDRHGAERVESWSFPAVEYPTAQQAMKRLLVLGLVRREPEVRASTGPPYQHFVTGEQPATDDALELLYQAPAFSGPGVK